MRGKVLCCAVLVALGALAGCSNQPEPSAPGDGGQPSGNAASSDTGSNAGSSAGGAGSGGPAANPGRTNKLTDALLPDNAFPTGSRISRSTTLPPRPDFSKAKSQPPDCAQKNAATQIGEGDGDIALANAATADGKAVITALVRPELDVVQTYRAFISSCRLFTLKTAAHTLRSRNNELNVRSLGEPEAIGFTQHTTAPGQVVDSVGIAVNTHGVTLNVVVVDQSGGTASKKLAFDLTRKALDRIDQVLRG